MIGAFAETADDVHSSRFEGTMNLHRMPVKLRMIGPTDSFRTPFRLGA